MRKYESLIIVGSSGAGKTTLVNGLRTPEYQDSVTVPRRYITRPERHGDDVTENHHVSHSTFESLVSRSKITPHWQRELDNNRVERYGFYALSSNENRLAVYSANNAFLRDRNPTVSKVLESGLVIIVMAASESRTTRLGDRSPDLSPDERAVRLEDSGIDILAADVDLEIIDTTNLTPDEGQIALRTITERYIN